MSPSTLSRISKIVLLAIPLAVISSPSEARTICPLYLIKYCALIHGHVQTPDAVGQAQTGVGCAHPRPLAPPGF